MASYRGIDGFEVIVSKNKFMLEESSIVLGIYFFCEGFDACLFSAGFDFYGTFFTLSLFFFIFTSATGPIKSGSSFSSSKYSFSYSSSSP